MTTKFLTAGRQFLLGILLVVLPGVLFALPAQISHIQVVDSGKSVRVIFHVKHLQRYDAFTLTDPNRAVIDIHDGQLATSLKQVSHPAVIKHMRSGSPKPGVLRIVLDMTSASEVESSHKQDAKGDGAELYFDIFPESFPKAAPKAAPKATPVAAKMEPKTVTEHKTKTETKTETKRRIGPAPKSFNIVKPITMTKPAEETKKTAALPAPTAPQKSAVMPPQPEALQKPAVVPQPQAAQKPASLPASPVTKPVAAIGPVAPAHPATKSAPTPADSMAATAANVKAAALNLFSKLRLPSLPALAEPAKPHPLMVVIDAGHGGKDSGTIGRNGTREKDIVLAISLQLAQLVNQDPNMHAVLTRTSDRFVTLEDRLTIARNQKADLFIAVHADSYFRNHSAGASVYALSQHGASSAAARWLADKENHSEVAGVDLNDKSAVLRSVLLDLAQTATISDSIKLGNDILASLESITSLHKPAVEQAPFMVLKSPDIPSVLVETGFLSNQNEEQRLNDTAYRNKLALALLQGIKVYAAGVPSVVASTAKPGDALVWEAEHVTA